MPIKLIECLIASICQELRIALELDKKTSGVGH